MGDVVNLPIRLYHGTITNRSGSMSLHSVRATNKESAQAFFEKEHPYAQKIEVNPDRNEDSNYEDKN